MRTQITNDGWVISILVFAFGLGPGRAGAEDYAYTTNNGAITITYYFGPGGAVTIPGVITGLPVTTIGDWAFVGIGSMTSVTIPNSVTRIGGWAFDNCTGLPSVVIPGSVTSIGEGAFAECTQLTAIEVEPTNPTYSSLGGVLFNKSQTTLLECPGGKAGGYTIPGSVTSIGDQAFFRCSLLTSVVFPDRVTRIGKQAFFNCSGLTSVVIPDGVTSIGDTAFGECTDLTSMTIPGSVTNIGDYALFRCGYLTGVYFEGDAPVAGTGLFDDSPYVTVFYLPGTSGWDAGFAGNPTAVWERANPVILNSSLGSENNAFGFRISWATNVPVVVEASASLISPKWSSVSTKTLTDGWSDFSDPDWVNYPNRFYRVRAE